MQKLINIIEETLLSISCICIIVVMLIVSFDALLRYLFNSPLSWAYEAVSYYLLITAAYFAISSTYKNGDHINIDLILRSMSKRMQIISDFICNSLAIVFFSIMAYSSYETLMEAFVNKEYHPGYYNWPAWISYMPILLGSLMLTVRIINHLIQIKNHGEDQYIKNHQNGELGVE